MEVIDIIAKMQKLTIDGVDTPPSPISPLSYVDSTIEKDETCKFPLEWSLTNYFAFLEKRIGEIMQRTENEIFTYDILDTEKTKQNKLIVLKEKQRQMKIGEIWQEVFGTYKDCINLKVGHETGLDILSHQKKIAVELKNRTNTDNASSKKTNMDKLAKFKKEHPDYLCIYANINADTEKKTKDGAIKKIIHNDVEIEHHVGTKFIQFMLGEDANQIIDFVRNTIDCYL